MSIMLLQHAGCAYTIPYATIQDIRITVLLWIIFFNNFFIVFLNLETTHMPHRNKIINTRVVSLNLEKKSPLPLHITHMPRKGVGYFVPAGLIFFTIPFRKNPFISVPKDVALMFNKKYLTNFSYCIILVIT